METIKVNMTPCEDIKTVHASQNDGEAREWGFILHNNGDVIDSSEITDQMVFKSYEGGTEQILPENGSTPTTSPFLGDIKYPQGLLSDQEFLYRESPTEEDGLAKITDIKGNTLVWNQLVQNGNFADTSIWQTPAISLQVQNNEATLKPTQDSNSASIRQAIDIKANHVYFIHYFEKPNKNVIGRCFFYDVDGNVFSPYFDTTMVGGQYNEVLKIVTATRDYNYFYIRPSSASLTTDTFFIKNVNLIDLTQMYGAGNKPATIEEFTSLFSLPYYAYNQGSLLSFNGTGIKTVSKNQFDTQVVTTSYVGLTLTKTQGTIRAVYSGGSQFAGFNFYGSPVFTDTFLKGRYRLSFDVSGLDTQWTVGLRQGASFVGTQAVAISNDGHYSFTIDAEANPNCYLSFARTGNKTTAYDVTFSNIQLELGTTETPYTPFEDKTISLPISQYFPDGMDGVGTAYDEQTNSGYVKRMFRVNLGSLTWRHRSEVKTSLFSATMPNYKKQLNTPSICARYGYVGTVYGVSGDAGASGRLLDKQYALFYQEASNDKVIYLYDTSFTTVDTLTSNLSGVYLCFELATPLENYGVVDLGTLDWIYNDSFKRFHSTGLSNFAKFPSNDTTVANILSNEFATVSAVYFNNNKTVDKLVALSMYGSIYARNLSMTDVNEFKSSLSGVYLLYEKQNSQGFTTATLVTENGEIPLSNEDGVLIGECTEQLSAEPGFHDAKIKLADEDGECYSNKLQLHVERSPQ